MVRNFALLIVFLLFGCVTTPSGKKAFLITSEQQEVAMGFQAYQEIMAKEIPSRNVKWNRMIQRVGSRLARVAHKPDYKWEFKLIQSDQANAFALPGGKVAFYTGILPVCANEAGVAAVMGHEIAHATLRHGGQRMSAAMGTQLGMLGLAAIMGGKGGSRSKGLLMAALGVGAQVGVMLPFSRSNETEADEMGLVYMAKAGYDPNESYLLWHRMAKNSGGAPPEFLSTHPASLKRAARLRSQVPSVMRYYQSSPRYGKGYRI